MFTKVEKSSNNVFKVAFILWLLWIKDYNTFFNSAKTFNISLRFQEKKIGMNYLWILTVGSFTSFPQNNP